MFKNIINYQLFIVIIIIIITTSAFSQTCLSNIERSTPNSNFTDNGDETITDNITGLMWKKCSEGLSGNSCVVTASTFTWQEALNKAKEVRETGFPVGAFKDWRLPNIKELDSILETACYAPSINEALFPGTQSDSYYWSSSFAAHTSENAWGISFNYGRVDSQSKNNKYYVRLVRAGK